MHPDSSTAVSRCITIIDAPQCGHCQFDGVSTAVLGTVDATGGQHALTYGELAGAEAVRQKPEGPDPDEALRQYVQYLDFSAASDTVQQLTAKLARGGPVLSVDAGLTAANLAKSSFRTPVRVAFSAKVIL